MGRPRKEGALDLSVKNRDARIKSVLETLQRKHGAESVIRISKEISSRKHPVFTTGSLLFDRALGGGWPRGRIVEVYGLPGSGKTSMSLQAIASAQREGEMAGFIDAEHAYDPSYAAAIGVRVEDVLFSQPEYGEQVFEIAETMIESGVGIIVIDSVAALIPKAELDGEITDMQIGLQARMLSKALRRMTSKVSRANCLVYFINQLRELIGQHGWGEPTVTPGGKALKYYASVRLDVRAGAKVKRGEEVIGHKLNLKVVKNKLAPPFQKVEIDLVYGKGLWRSAEVLDLAVEHGLVEKSGAWFSYAGERIGQGREHAADRLEAQPAVFSALEKQVRKKMEDSNASAAR